LHFCGGAGAPARARQSVLAQLEGGLVDAQASDAALLVSELVTNSVVHADVGAGETLTVELLELEDRLRITVIDPGSPREPRLPPRVEHRQSQFGLLLIDQLSETWGFARGGAGTMHVWCELLLEPSPPL
jgi:anti-sigma regulatory factor (Ser/Thr protein kinase)